MKFQRFSAGALLCMAQSFSATASPDGGRQASQWQYFPLYHTKTFSHVIYDDVQEGVVGLLQQRFYYSSDPQEPYVTKIRLLNLEGGAAIRLCSIAGVELRKEFAKAKWSLWNNTSDRENKIAEGHFDVHVESIGNGWRDYSGSPSPRNLFAGAFSLFPVITVSNEEHRKNLRRLIKECGSTEGEFITVKGYHIGWGHTPPQYPRDQVSRQYGFIYQDHQL